MNDLNRTTSMPPPYEDRDCHEPKALEVYTNGYMVRTMEAGKKQSSWRATFSDAGDALREIRVCLNDHNDDLEDRYLEVSLWHNGKPIEFWKRGRPQLGSGVAA